jgi:hypothetical protein
MMQPAPWSGKCIRCLKKTDISKKERKILRKSMIPKGDKKNEKSSQVFPSLMKMPVIFSRSVDKIACRARHVRRGVSCAVHSVVGAA